MTSEISQKSHPSYLTADYLTEHFHTIPLNYLATHTTRLSPLPDYSPALQFIAFKESQVGLQFGEEVNYATSLMQLLRNYLYKQPRDSLYVYSFAQAKHYHKEGRHYWDLVDDIEYGLLSHFIISYRSGVYTLLNYSYPFIIDTTLRPSQLVDTDSLVFSIQTDSDYIEIPETEYLNFMEVLISLHHSPYFDRKSFEDLHSQIPAIRSALISNNCQVTQYDSVYDIANGATRYVVPPYVYTLAKDTSPLRYTF